MFPRRGAEAIVTFYDKHYPREANGQIRFEPAQSLETWWNVVKSSADARIWLN